MFRALYEQRHEPNTERGNAMPIERSPIKDEPKHRINDKDAMIPGAASSYSEKAARRILRQSR